MSGLLGRKPPVERSSNDTSVISIDDDEAAPVFDTLSVPTARSILAELYSEPAAKSDLADSVGSSLQNVSYHLDNLEEAGLVEVIDQWYSEKGTEMDVYAPTGGAVVLLPDEAGAEAVEPVVGGEPPTESGPTAGD